MSLILTCPECATRYVAKADGFRPPGRNVRCSRCDHMWFQEVAAPESYETLYDLYEGKEKPAGKKLAGLFGGDEEDAPSRSLFKRGRRLGRKKRSAGPEMDDDFSSFRTYQPERRSRLTSGVFYGLVSIMILGVLGTGSVFFAPQVRNYLPSVDGVVSMLPTPGSGTSFKFENTAYSRVFEDGEDVLIVSGELINDGEQSVPVPTIRAILRDSDQQDIDEWTFSPRGQVLEPGEARYFESRRVSPPTSAYRLHLIVVEEG